MFVFESKIQFSKGKIHFQRSNTDSAFHSKPQEMLLGPGRGAGPHYQSDSEAEKRAMPLLSGFERPGSWEGPFVAGPDLGPFLPKRTKPTGGETAATLLFKGALMAPPPPDSFLEVRASTAIPS